jgi:hypothetical protein
MGFTKYLMKIATWNVRALEAFDGMVVVRMFGGVGIDIDLLLF